MIREELKRLGTGPRELRKFGLTVGGVFLALGAWFLVRHKPVWPYLLAPGAVLFGLGLALPRSLRTIYLGWMALALALGLIVSTVLLSLFFYLAITPVSLLARCFGKDFLQRRLDRQTKSYWLRRAASADKPPQEYERQF